MQLDSMSLNCLIYLEYLICMIPLVKGMQTAIFMVMATIYVHWSRSVANCCPHPHQVINGSVNMHSILLCILVGALPFSIERKALGTTSQYRVYITLIGFLNKSKQLGDVSGIRLERVGLPKVCSKSYLE